MLREVFDISNVVVCKSAMPESQVEGHSGCWVCIFGHRLSCAIQKRRIVAIDAGDEKWGTRAARESHVCCINMDNK